METTYTFDAARFEQKLRAEMARIIGDAGQVIYVHARGLGDWTVVFDTEYAALKAFYAYRGSKGIRFGTAVNPAGWRISIVAGDASHTE